MYFSSGGALKGLLGVVGSVSGGGITLRVPAPPHSSMGVPLGQQPASV